ncbi:unnamed protein product [Eruca vesicaria subsp. sativa]|uniref:Uncharacterized protein n=1 Tax=Eruca vesicaria subsp. sativa TaxID=29727 RepID=A0ABC8LM16_ERUVS|nr:unnamed protein product [Eruca vesicaria subsp. sativa]
MKDYAYGEERNPKIWRNLGLRLRFSETEPYRTIRFRLTEVFKNTDQEDNTILHTGIERSSPIIWAPRRSVTTFSPPRAPSLQQLSMRVLVKNADAITSLDYVPDALRVKLCQLLCDSRRMDLHFLDLLVRGSPTVVHAVFPMWGYGHLFPLLLLLDLPISAKCSLLTSSSIDMLSDSLGSVLRELYLNECQSIDLKLILTAFKKFEKLEVLSLVDLPSVRGRLLRKFVTARGQALKQLILTNSVKLTDSSIKDISENCPNLSVLDLVNVCKLTDCALGYLANGCQALEKLIFCRNSFRQVSLQLLFYVSIVQVGHNTALALAKLSEKLQILDVPGAEIRPTMH